MDKSFFCLEFQKWCVSESVTRMCPLRESFGFGREIFSVSSIFVCERWCNTVCLGIMQSVYEVSLQ